MSFDTQKLALQALAGHGHVKPRPDGVRMRCGGPAVCRVCQQEKAQLETSQRINEAFHPLDGQHINQGSVDAATEAYEREFLQAKIDTQAAEIAEAKGQVEHLDRQNNALREAMARLIRGYVNLLESGRDRITFLGGDCDPVDVMEASDPWLKDARAALSGEPNA